MVAQRKRQAQFKTYTEVTRISDLFQFENSFTLPPRLKLQFITILMASMCFIAKFYPCETQCRDENLWDLDAFFVQPILCGKLGNPGKPSPATWESITSWTV